ncbi:unnamed protein product, partial [Heterosigma akashiwo]
EDAVSSLVVGTEARQVLVLDPTGSSIVAGVTLQGVPAMMCVSGLFDVEWRIVVACRDGRVYTVKSGDLRSKTAVVETQPVALAFIDKLVYVATMAQAVHCFLQKGKKNYTLAMPAPVTNMEVLSVKKVGQDVLVARVVSALLVALANGEVRLYRDKHLLHTLRYKEVVAGLRFGQYGREESSLVGASPPSALA